MNHDSAVVRLFSAKRVKATFALLILACAAAFVPATRADNLHYFKNYFVTGDYTVAGVGLFGKGVNGTATGTINMTTVPAGADIVAAFLYWQTVEMSSAPSTINGVFDGNPIVGEALGNPSTASCWSQGGTSPQTSARVYRADVLRYFTNIDPVNHVRIVNGNHTVQFPDSGSTLMSVLPHTEGATLVIVYRMLQVGAASYKSVVMFDGANTMSKFGPAFSTTLGGFYDAAGPDAHGNLTAKMTEIVGNGQPNFAVGLTVNGKTPAGVNSTVLDGSAGTRWDNPTFAISLAQGASSVTTQVSPGNNQVCLTWGAILMSTDVENTDGDGNLNSWKLNGMHFDPGKAAYPNPVPATFGDCTTNPQNCENFKAMGAVLGTPAKPHPDVFVQIDWLERTDGPAALNHIHAPKLAALQMIYNVFQSHGIYVHFDVGNRYQFNPPKPFIIPGPSAKGGNVVQESTLFCPNAIITDYTKCEYVTDPSAPGGLGYLVSGWKIGLDAFKNGFPILKINNPLLPPDRKDTFRYAVFGHALGGPSDPITGKPLSATPPSSSGVADLLGGDILVTLGLWSGDNPTPMGGPCTQDDPSGTVPDGNLCIDKTGTSLQQAGTLMHELGHTLGLRHGGGASLPNCMPIYPSVMNYLYQTHGLTDQAGNENIDYSAGTLAPVNENGLYENTALGLLAPLKYRIRYYAPASAAELVAGSEAKAHCDGSSTMGANEVREEAPFGKTPDWDNDGDQNTPDGTAVSVDVNFNGSFTDVMNDYNDWANLNLRQVGARPNVGGLSVEVGPLDLGSTDLGQTELGQTELGQTELGQTELGQTELGQTELGQTELGQTELGEVDYSAAISSLEPTGPINAPANDPNGLLEASLASDATLASSGQPGNNEVVLNWGGPTLGQIRTFNIWRTNVTPAAIFPQTVQVGTVSAVGAMPPTTFTDKVNDFLLKDSGAQCPATSTCYNATYQYFITASDTNGTISNASNFVTAIVDHLFVTAYSGSVIYGNTLPNYSSTGATVSGLPAGGITASAFTCTNTTGSVPPRNVGSYTITCAGPAVGNPATVGLTYIPGTLTITARPLTIAAQPNSRVYDSTVSAATKPLVTNLAYNDTVTNLTETYASPNVSNSDTLSVFSYALNDGNSGNNYAVTLTTAVGSITQRPLTIAAQPNAKIYDSTTSAATLPVVQGPPNGLGLVGTDSVTGLAEVYAGPNVSNNDTLSVSSYTVMDGNAGGNYAVTLTTTIGTITRRPLTIAAQPNSRVYDGTTSAAALPIVLGPPNGLGLAGNDTVTNLAETYASPNFSGNDTLSVSSYTVNDGNSGGNYAVTLTTAVGMIAQRQLSIVAVPFSRTYDGTTSAAVVPTLTGLVTPRDSVTGLTEAFTSSAASAPNAATLVVVASYTVNDGNGGNNYTVSLFSAPGTINPYPLTAIAAGVNKIYDATTAATVTFSDNRIQNVGDTFTYTYSASFATPNVGTAISVSVTGISLTGTGATNYTLQNTTANTTANITAAPLTATVTGTSPNFSYSVSGFLGGDGAALVTGALSCTVDATADSAGNFPISCSGLSAPNYVVSYSYQNGSGGGTQPLTVALNGTQTYGGSPTFTLTYSGFVAPDSPAVVTGTLTCTTNGNSASTVGTVLVVTGCSGLSAPNYNISYWLGTVTVTQAPLTVIVTGTAPNFVVGSYVGFIGTDTPSVVTGTLSCIPDGTADSAGNFPISCSGLNAPNYYDVSYSYAPASVGVSPAPLTVAVNGTQPVGGMPTFTVTYSGFVNGDALSVVTGTLSCTTTATPSSPAGSYAISSCSGLSAPGTYVITYWLGTVTVM